MTFCAPHLIFASKSPLPWNLPTKVKMITAKTHAEKPFLSKTVGDVVAWLDVAVCTLKPGKKGTGGSLIFLQAAVFSPCRYPFLHSSPGHL